MEGFLCIAMAIAVNLAYGQPHMDEIFHIRQLGKYLDGEFSEWDPKITTLPGLYFVFYAVLKLFPLQYLFPLLSVCRVLNAFLVYVCSRLLEKINPNAKSLILLYPPLFMSSALFYTDTLSLLMNLLYYYCKCKNLQVLSFFIAILAVFCRQTNIIWIGFFAGIIVFQQNGVVWIRDFQKITRNILEILKKNIGEVVVALGFIVFVMKNHGITVGDQENHKPGVHLAQICYLFAILSLMVPISKLQLKQTLFSMKWLFLLPIVHRVILTFSYSHSFLLSDNTHYTFYLWKNLLSPYKLLLIPYYSICLYHFQRIFELKFVWWAICSCLTLIPATLLELRYFIMPVTCYLLTYAEPPTKLRLSALVSINLITFAVFTLKPYKDIGFMW